MSDRMMRHLEELAQKELPLRRDAMARILEQTTMLPLYASCSAWPIPFANEISAPGLPFSMEKRPETREASFMFPPWTAL